MAAIKLSSTMTKFNSGKTTMMELNFMANNHSTITYLKYLDIQMLVTSDQETTALLSFAKFQMPWNSIS